MEQKYVVISVSIVILLITIFSLNSIWKINTLEKELVLKENLRLKEVNDQNTKVRQNEVIIKTLGDNLNDVYLQLEAKEENTTKAIIEDFKNNKTPVIDGVWKKYEKVQKP